MPKKLLKKHFFKYVSILVLGGDGHSKERCKILLSTAASCSKSGKLYPLDKFLSTGKCN